MISEQLTAAKNALKTVGSVDVATIDGPTAVGLLRQVSTLKAMVGYIELTLSRRVEQTNQHQEQGFSSGADLVAHETGQSGSDVARSLATARYLEELPETSARFASGSLSLSQASEVARGAHADPRAEAELLARADRDSVESLRRKRSALETSRIESLITRRQRQKFCCKEGDRGMTDFWGSLANEDFAALKSEIDQRAKTSFRSHRRLGLRKPQSFYMAEGLVEVFRNVGHGPGTSQPKVGSQSRPTINVIVDYSLLVQPREAEIGSEPLHGCSRDSVSGAEPNRDDGVLGDNGHSAKDSRLANGFEGVCEIAGVGPISVETARQWANDCWLNVILTKGKDVMTIGSESRYIPVELRRAVEIQQRLCGVRGCENSVGLELDHKDEMRHGGLTAFENLGWLCRHHHNLKTYKGFRVKGRPGDYTLVPPELVSTTEEQELFPPETG